MTWINLPGNLTEIQPAVRTSEAMRCAAEFKGVLEKRAVAAAGVAAGAVSWIRRE
jgi:hypothetical protein